MWNFYLDLVLLEFFYDPENFGRDFPHLDVFIKLEEGRSLFRECEEPVQENLMPYYPNLIQNLKNF